MIHQFALVGHPISRISFDEYSTPNCCRIPFPPSGSGSHTPTDPVGVPRMGCILLPTHSFAISRKADINKRSVSPLEPMISEIDQTATSSEVRSQQKTIFYSLVLEAE